MLGLKSYWRIKLNLTVSKTDETILCNNVDSRLKQLNFISNHGQNEQNIIARILII